MLSKYHEFDWSISYTWIFAKNILLYIMFNILFNFFYYFGVFIRGGNPKFDSESIHIEIL